MRRQLILQVHWKHYMVNKLIFKRHNFHIYLNLQNMKLTTVFLILFLTLISCQTNSHLRLPSLIGDDMLLQQKTTARIWGKANPGQKITVSASWKSDGQAIAGKDGKWSLNLNTPEAGGPYIITISAKDTTIAIKNVLIGEV